MRSLVFNLVFCGWTTLIVIVSLPLILVPSRKPLAIIINIWARAGIWMMRRIGGIDLQIRGAEHMPAMRPCIIAAKHQSWSDGIIMAALMPDVASVAMKELLSIPLVGTILKKMRMIMVDTCGGGGARQTLNDGAQQAARDERPILIYPEGRLTPIGERSAYKSGIHMIYEELGLPVTPVATNIGLRWPCRSFSKYPGPAVVEFLPAISPGLDRKSFMSALEVAIELESDRLVIEHGGSRTNTPSDI